MTLAEIIKEIESGWCTGVDPAGSISLGEIVEMLEVYGSGQGGPFMPGEKVRVTGYNSSRNNDGADPNDTINIQGLLNPDKRGGIFRYRLKKISNH